MVALFDPGFQPWVNTSIAPYTVANTGAAAIAARGWAGGSETL